MGDADAASDADCVGLAAVNLDGIRPRFGLDALRCPIPPLSGDAVIPDIWVQVDVGVRGEKFVRARHLGSPLKVMVP